MVSLQDSTKTNISYVFLFLISTKQLLKTLYDLLSSATPCGASTQFTILVEMKFYKYFYLMRYIVHLLNLLIMMSNRRRGNTIIEGEVDDKKI